MVLLHHPEVHTRMAVPEGTTLCRDYGRGRHCANDDCRNVLSRYNPGPFCNGCEGRREGGEQVSKETKTADRTYVCELLRRGGTWTRKELAAEVGITERSIAQHVSGLRRAGHDIDVRDVDGVVTYTYRAAPKTTPTTSTASAPVPEREQPATPATDSASPSEPSPDAGTWRLCEDAEVVAIRGCVDALEELTDDGRERVFRYLAARYGA